MVVYIYLSFSQKAQPKKHQEEKHHTISHTSLLYAQIQKSIIMEELKASGNAAFKKGDFASAVDFFTRAIDAEKTLENHHVLYSNRSAARVRCCCRRQKSSSSSFSHRFKVVSILERAFFFGRRRRRQSLSLCCASKRVDRNVCRGSVVSVGLDAFIRGDTNLLSVRGGGGGGAREEGEEEEEENFSKG